MTEPRSSSLPTRLLLVAGFTLVPVLVAVLVCWVAARQAADVWPPVDTPEILGPPPALSACADSSERLEALLEAAAGLDGGALEEALNATASAPDTRPEIADDAGVAVALDALLECGGLRAVGPQASAGPRGAARLRAAAWARLLRAWSQDDPVAAAADLASVLRLSAIVGQRSGDTDLFAASVSVGLDALEQLEAWLGAHPALPEPALARMAEELAFQTELPAGVHGALVWHCRQQEIQLRSLGGIHAPAMLMQQAGVPMLAGWASTWLPGATPYDAPRTIAMHRQRCARRLESVAGGGLWSEAEPGPPLWDPAGPSLGTMLDNPLGRSTLERQALGSSTDLLIQAERTLRSRRVLLATRVALRRGALAHDGGWPSHLDLLVPDFLPELRVDPVDGQPIHWVRGHGEVFTTREVARPDGSTARLFTRLVER